VEKNLSQKDIFNLRCTRKKGRRDTKIPPPCFLGRGKEEPPTSFVFLLKKGGRGGESLARGKKEGTGPLYFSARRRGREGREMASFL